MKSDQELRNRALELLDCRGVTLVDIAELVLHLQAKYVDKIDLEICLESVQSVVKKREVQNAIITGIELDMLAEEGKLSQPLNDILMEDEGLYGIDEILALAIVNVYGTIGFTNFGYLDKVKPGIIRQLDQKANGKCHTFLDDIVSAIAASAASRIAHARPDQSDITK